LKLAYDAVDAKGKKVRSSLQAATIRTGVEELRRQGLFVTSIVQTKDDAAGTGITQSSSDRNLSAERLAESSKNLTQVRMPSSQRILFTRQVAMLLASGSALAPALNAVAQQTQRPDLRGVVDSLVRELEQGTPLAEALRKYPNCFDAAYCAVVAAGESSASLPKMFGRLAAILGKRRATRNRVVGALIYPALLIFLSVKILAVMLFFVIPRFAGMFDTLGVPLPGSTRVMMSIATGARSGWPIILALVLAVIGGLYTLIRTKPGRQFASNMQVRIPVAGKLASRIIQAQSFRILGMLLEARVGLLDALGLARQVTRNDRFQTMYDSLVEAVTRGDSLSGSLEQHRLLSPSVIQALRTGEQSGRLGESITFVADVLDEENGELLNTLVRLIEPAILILMGVVVGTVAVSLFMPLFDMTAAV
jgi:type II secretory pathway component PulF